jgi:hypothetical protein
VPPRLKVAVHCNFNMATCHYASFIKNHFVGINESFVSVLGGEKGYHLPNIYTLIYALCVK